MTKAEKLRKAAKVCWALGAFFTWSFIRTVLADSIQEPAVLWTVAVIASLALQYVLTLVEGTIIEGMLPAPWNLDFKQNMTLSILAIAAYGCFILDIMLNLGGVYVFTSKLGTAIGDVKQLGISDYLIQIVQFIATFFLAMLFALGSELLETLADQYDGIHRRPRPQEHRREHAKAGPPLTKQVVKEDNTVLQERLLAARANRKNDGSI